LAKEGYVTVTGGGPGFMNEVMRGAYENKGETIGICLNIEGRIHSPFLTQKEVFDNLMERQKRLLDLAHAFVALPGGIGTLYEIVEVLALKRKKEIPSDKPLILISDFYQQFIKMIEQFIAEGMIFEECSKYYELVPDVAVAMKLLKGMDEI
jgi:uncharacterized protein (TIGR00730 family)